MIIQEKDVKKRRPKKKASEAMDIEETNDDSREESIIRGNDESNDATELEYRLKSFGLRKVDEPKKITSEQLQWYCTPLRLETVTKLLQVCF